MKKFESDLLPNPSFNTVLNLSNRTFDGTNIVTGRGATEDQLLIVHNYLVELEARQDECCAEEWSRPMLENLSNRLDELEERIEQCCQNSCFEGGANPDVSNCTGSQITVSMSWNGSTAQVNAISSSGATITFYFFLVKRSSNVWAPASVVDHGGNKYKINTSTGVITIEGVTAEHQLFAIMARDENGCEGLGSFVPPT